MFNVSGLILNKIKSASAFFNEFLPRLILFIFEFLDISFNQQLTNNTPRLPIELTTTAYIANIANNEEKWSKITATQEVIV